MERKGSSRDGKMNPRLLGKPGGGVGLCVMLVLCLDRVWLSVSALLSGCSLAVSVPVGECWC